MKLINILLTSLFLFQFSIPVNARDDLTLKNEISVIDNFSNRYGIHCSQSANNVNVKSIPMNVKSACESMAGKVQKAMRHCATATDANRCLGVMTDEDTGRISYNLSCCGDFKRSGKMK